MIREGSRRRLSKISKRLEGIWGLNHYDYSEFKQWFSEAGPKLTRFKERYSSQAVESYGILKLAFWELEHFETSLQDMEKVSKAYESSVARNLSDKSRERCKQCLEDDESMALEAITKTIKYVENG